MTIGDREVLIIEPEFSAPPSIIGNRATTIATIAEATRVAQFSGKHAVHTLNHSFLFTDKEQIEDFQDFFETRAGKWGAFWAPSWTAELNPVAHVANGGTTIAISPVDYENVYLADLELTRLGHYVFLLHTDGTIFITRVTAANYISLVGDILTIETPAPRQFLMGDFIIGFCYFVRFASDKLSLEFDGPNQARTKMAMIEVILVDAPGDPAFSPDIPPVVTPEAWTDKDGAEWTDASGEAWTN